MTEPLCLLVGDIHFDVYSRFSKLNDDGKNSRAWSLIETVRDIFDYAKENKIDTVICLGDVFNTSLMVKTQLFNDVLALFTKYAKHFEIYILPGNHDYHSFSEPSIVAPFGVAKNIYVAARNGSAIELGGKRLVLVPYWENGTDLANELKGEKGDVLLVHQSANGAMIGKYELVKPSDAIDRKRFEFGKIISGHIHGRQQAGGIEFIGSIAQKDFGDEGIEKFFAVLNRDLTLSYIKTNAPTFSTIEIGSAEDVLEANKKINDTNFFRVKTKKSLWEAYGNELQGSQNIAVEYQPDELVTETRIDVSLVNNPQKLLTEYLFLSSKDNEWVANNHAKLLEMGLELLKD